jgi:hypothetical protein
MTTTLPTSHDQNPGPADSSSEEGRLSPTLNRGADLLAILEAYFLNQANDSFYSSSILPACRK